MTDADLVAAYVFPPTGPCLRISMVTTLDGATRGHDGNSKSISTPADARVFSLLRRSADAILVAAGTVRAERYRPSKKQVAIVSRSGDLPLDLPLLAERSSDMPRPLILTSARTAEGASIRLRYLADLVACGDDDVDLRLAVQALVDRGFRRIACEGGPTLLGELARLDLIDEISLNITPTLLGAPEKEHLLTVPGGEVGEGRWRVIHVLEEDGTTFLRLGRP